MPTTSGPGRPYSPASADRSSCVPASLRALPGAAPPSTTISRPSAPKNDPESRRRKLHTQQRLPDGGLGPPRRRLWKGRHSEPIGLFYNVRLHRLARRDVVPFHAVILRPGEDRVRGELGAVVRDDHARLAAVSDQFQSVHAPPGGRRSRSPGSQPGIRASRRRRC